MLIMMRAAENHFPDTIILMCFFHVMQNVRTYKNLIVASNYKEFLEDMQILHSSESKRVCLLVKSRFIEYTKLIFKLNKCLIV